MKDIRVFTVLFLQLFCRLEILPNGKVKEKKWEQGEEAAKEKSRRRGQAPGSRGRGCESRKAAEAAGRWEVARMWGRLKSSLRAVGGTLQSWRFRSAGELEVPGVGSTLLRVSPEVAWRMAGQARGARQHWAKAFVGRERPELFAQKRRKG